MLFLKIRHRLQIHSKPGTYKFTIDKRPDLWYRLPCYLEQTRYVAPLTPLESALTRTARFCTILVQIGPLDSALTDTPPVTPLECALTKTSGGGGASLAILPITSGQYLRADACPDAIGMAKQLQICTILGHP
jgi:hypothetical protein